LCSLAVEKHPEEDAAETLDKANGTVVKIKGIDGGGRF
jgi:hypothetical protein